LRVERENEKKGLTLDRGWRVKRGGDVAGR
jgi:hypothetical protein